MKKIAYIELDTHAEIAVNFMELMADSKAFEVDYYFSERIIKRIGKHQSNIYLSENTELLHQLNQLHYDLVIIGTVHRYFNLFNEIVSRFNTSVIVHNLNFTKISRFQLFKNIFKKDVKYRLKLWLKEDLLSAPKVFKNAENLLVLDQSLIQNKLKFLPVFFNQYHVHTDSEVLTIVIPGAVSQQRRDYKKVLQELIYFQEIDSEKSVQVIFLGKARGKELLWLQDFEKEKSNQVSIQYFTEKVPQNIFDEWMNAADVLWCPIQRETEFFSHKEIYGKTKMTGNIGDAIKYGKTAFFPENYPTDFEFIINRNNNLGPGIFDFKGDEGAHFRKDFSKNKVKSELEKVLTSIL